VTVPHFLAPCIPVHSATLNAFPMLWLIFCFGLCCHFLFMLVRNKLFQLVTIYWLYSIFCFRVICSWLNWWLTVSICINTIGLMMNFWWWTNFFLLFFFVKCSCSLLGPEENAACKNPVPVIATGSLLEQVLTVFYVPTWLNNIAHVILLKFVSAPSLEEGVPDRELSGPGSPG